MKVIRKLLAACILIGGIGAAAPIWAADNALPEMKPVAQASSKGLVLKEDAQCTKCHDESDNPALLAIGKTKHGVRADARTPTCVSCHGDSPTHVNKPDGVKDRPLPDRTFGKKSMTPAADRNAACMTCHEKDTKRHLWAGSAHEARDVACSSCHQVHAARDKVKDKLTQSEVCFACHKEQRAQYNKPSRHPTLEGKVACSDCHNPHGSAGPVLMKRDSVVDTCYTCHMEKRGPFVRNHQPVAEDCSICHNPHGTTTPNLLKARTPYLCQECHEPSSHRGNVASLSVAGGSTATNTVARGCLNCHTQIHGTNNPQNINTERSFRR